MLLSCIGKFHPTQRLLWKYCGDESAAKDETEVKDFEEQKQKTRECEMIGQYQRVLQQQKQTHDPCFDEQAPAADFDLWPSVRNESQHHYEFSWNDAIYYDDDDDVTPEAPEDMEGEERLSLMQQQEHQELE